MSSNTAFSQSKGIQFTQSLGLQRGHGYGDPLQTWELVIIEHFTELSLRHDPEPPAPAPIPHDSLTAELLSVDWGIFNETARAPQNQEFVIVYDPAATPTRFQHMYNGRTEAQFEWRIMPLQTSYPINNMFPGLPVFLHRGNSEPQAYTGQGSLQCSFWKTQTGIDAPRAVWRSWTIAQRCRYKWNRPVTHGFFAVGNIWWLDQFGYKYGFNPEGNTLAFNQINPGRISLEDVTLVSEHTNVGSNTWIEPPYSFDQGQPGGFTDGFAGQIMLSIDFETPAEWSARTGIRVN